MRHCQHTHAQLHAAAVRPVSVLHVPHTGRHVPGPSRQGRPHRLHAGAVQRAVGQHLRQCVLCTHTKRQPGERLQALARSLSTTSIVAIALLASPSSGAGFQQLLPWLGLSMPPGRTQMRGHSQVPPRCALQQRRPVHPRLTLQRHRRNTQPSATDSSLGPPQALRNLPQAHVQTL